MILVRTTQHKGSHDCGNQVAALRYAPPSFAAGVGDRKDRRQETKGWLRERELGNAQELLREFEAKRQAQRGGKRGRPARADKGR